MKPRPTKNQFQTKISVQDVRNDSVEWAHENEEMRRIQVVTNVLSDKIDNLTNTISGNTDNDSGNGSSSSLSKTSIANTNNYFGGEQDLTIELDDKVVRRHDVIDIDFKNTPMFMEQPLEGKVVFDVQSRDIFNDNGDKKGKVEVSARVFVDKEKFPHGWDGPHRNFIECYITTDDLNYAINENPNAYRFFLGEISDYKLSWAKLINRTFVEVIEPIEVEYLFQDSDIDAIWYKIYNLGENGEIDLFIGEYEQLFHNSICANESGVTIPESYIDDEPMNKCYLLFAFSGLIKKFTKGELRIIIQY